MPEVELVGVCDKDTERLHQAWLEFDKPVFTEYRTMLENAKPHVVHVITSPSVPRHTWIEPGCSAGVKTLVLEKPHALTPFEHKMVCEAVQACNGEMEVLVNHQRRYMAPFYALRELLANEALGTLTHVYIQSQGEIMEMGTHVMDILLLIAGEDFPGMVWGVVQGDLYDRQYLKCPANLTALMGFSPQYRVNIEVTEAQIRAPDWSGIDGNKYNTSHFPNRLNLFVHGKSGEFWWREYGGWGYRMKNGIERGEEDGGTTDYLEDDLAAQKRFNKHLWRNLQPTHKGEKERPLHWGRFELAQRGLELLFMVYKSSLLGEPIFSPVDNGKLSQEEWGLLKSQLTGEGDEACEKAENC
jgi:predicted dehydrogenase